MLILKNAHEIILFSQRGWDNCENCTETSSSGSAYRYILNYILCRVCFVDQERMDGTKSVPATDILTLQQATNWNVKSVNHLFIAIQYRVVKNNNLDMI